MSELPWKWFDWAIFAFIILGLIIFIVLALLARGDL